MRNLKLAIVAALLAYACPAFAQNEFKTPTSGKTVVGLQIMCQNASAQAIPCGDATTPLQIAGTFSAALGGFTPSLSGARGTPVTVTTADSSGTLPTGTVVDVSNVGSNPMYCNVNGVAATTADKLIASNSWFEFTIPSGVTTLHCIATGGSTAANTVGGSGLGTGAGGGSSGGGSGGNVNLTQIAGAAPSLTNPLWVSPATGATFPVSAASLPLPTGAATQTTSAAILTALGSPFQAGGSIGNTTFASTQSGTWNITNISGTISLPTGASTSALQTTGNTSLGTIATNSGTQATSANQTTGNTSLATIATNSGLPLPAQLTHTVDIGAVDQISPYPAGATPITASATGTTAATTATLAGTTGKTTYICGYSIRANATAATTVTNTITGVITATLSSIMWVAPAASGLGVDEQIFSPCIPASATNTGIAIVSGAPGSGGAVSSKGWGYQL